jgi:magnesium transporter
MIKCYKNSESKLVEKIDTTLIDNKLIWVDMISPDKAEEHDVEAMFSLDVPTKEEMLEIEVSSRLYYENDALYITVTLMTELETDEPESHSVTFIIKDNTLITLRYSEQKSFNIFLGRVARNQTEEIKNGFDVFIGIIEAVIDCISDALKIIGQELDQVSKSVFQKTSKSKNSTDFQEILKKIGHYGDLNGKLSESLLSMSQVFIYLMISGKKYKKHHKDSIETYDKDINSLIVHTNYFSNRVNLLLDATLGMINIRQNAIIKIFSIAAVVFLPPTLIASIYGMNFIHMPELKWLLGYPFAIALMCISSIVPYLYFKKKGWL